LGGVSRAKGGDVDAVGTVDRAVPLPDGDDARAVLPVEDRRDVRADVAEPLHRDAPALEAAVEPDLGEFLGLAEQLSEGVDHAACDSPFCDGTHSTV
jgi:hypothetical protein